MSSSKNIFREYDIRGVVDEDLTEEMVYRVGKGFAAVHMSAGGRIAVGRDSRPHSGRLQDALAGGLESGGLTVVDIGEVTTPMLYFAEKTLNVQAGIQVTGSHNPPEFNGLKMCLEGRAIFGAEIQAIADHALTGEQPTLTPPRSLQRESIVDRYIDACAERLSFGPRRVRVVGDAGNGTAGPFAVKLMERLGVDFSPLYCDVDPSFPNHHPDPTVEANLSDLKREVGAQGADLGVAWDGDGDRLGAIDEGGSVLWGDELLTLFARDVLRTNRGATIIGEVKCSQRMYEDIEKQGGRPVMWKTGHSLIKDKMKETKALLAGEMSGHLFFADRWFGFDDGLYAAARLCELLSRSEKPLSSFLADLPQVYSTPEIRVDCADEQKFDVVERAIRRFREQGLDVVDVDGARVRFPDGWALIRASNTQPVLVLRFEASTEPRRDELEGWMRDELAQIAG